MKKGFYLITFFCVLCIVAGSCSFGKQSEPQKDSGPANEELQARLEHSLNTAYTVDNLFLRQEDVPAEAHYQLTSINILTYDNTSVQYETITAEITGDSEYATAVAQFQFISYYGENDVFYPQSSTPIHYSIHKGPKDELIQAFFNDVIVPSAGYIPETYKYSDFELLESSIERQSSDSESADLMIDFKVKYPVHAYKSATETWEYTCSFQTGFWRIDEWSRSVLDSTYEYYMPDCPDWEFDKQAFELPGVLGEYEIDFAEPVWLDPNDPLSCHMPGCTVRLLDDSIFDVSDVRIDFYYTLAEGGNSAMWNVSKREYSGEIKIKTPQPTVIYDLFSSSEPIEVTINGLRYYNDYYGYMFIVDIKDLREYPSIEIQEGERLMRCTSSTVSGINELENPIKTDRYIYVSSSFVPEYYN